ncbi:hypothetical protein CKN63_03265 [Carnobacterium divergens]|uniref:DUF6978 family protein n=1 Tax=Carnobacterium divergens TaxID=2748 RepID=UPI0010723875|nr:hypothetical protein [Carnobacterium divergens]TFI67833.1 hypothetical protein CKN59_03225 [Carnobacterium divergens]TFI67879.1 hypothetical protein CKN76_03300 [Carnobacterium divergens]TFI82779.1 hypothetical protein CKN74_03265 [Carnobacterium divergens]TFJ08900.1 hypothetical protein CKN75_03295 [Carnobacterium divergens]TFJ14034.1 hypothetical protein CKN71_03295 [Carnobacterium divergens]
MEQKVYENLLKCVKILVENDFNYPGNGIQSKHMLHEKEFYKNKFNLIINRKGRERSDCLSYLMFSESKGILVRLDMTGPPHTDRYGIDIDTPHVHIFDEEHNDGKFVEPLATITDKNIKGELIESLVVFFKYLNIDLTDIIIMGGLN